IRICNCPTGDRSVHIARHGLRSGPRVGIREVDRELAGSKGERRIERYLLCLRLRSGRVAENDVRLKKARPLGHRPLPRRPWTVFQVPCRPRRNDRLNRWLQVRRNQNGEREKEAASKQAPQQARSDVFQLTPLTYQPVTGLPNGRSFSCPYAAV